MQLPALFFCRPLFRKGFVSISISDHPPGIRIFCCSRWERSFFFAIPHFGRILFSLVWISSPSNLMNSPCAFFSLLVIKRIAKNCNYSFGRFVLLGLAFFFLSLSLIPRVFWFLCREIPSRKAASFGIILGKSL